MAVAVPPSVGELDPHLWQRGQGRGLPACQVSSWSLQPFGHSAPTSQTGQDNGPIALCEPFYKRSPKKYSDDRTFLWPPCVADADIIFLPCGFFFFFFLFFFPCLISAIGYWMSTILPDMVWPYCEFRMQVWNVLHAARWKYRMQKIAIWAPSYRFVGLYLCN